MRWGLGPVFLYECLANSRRWQTYAIRSAGVAILLAAIASIATSRASQFPSNPWRSYAELGVSYFYAIVGVELTLVMLAAPAATAGAICVDRARGTLTHILATDLSDPEIVLGKLGARLLPVLGLVACTWPVLAISSLLGGIDPAALTWAFAIILAVALLGCTMAMALSVWARKPHEVVMVTYTFWMVVLLLWPVWLALSMGGLVSRPPHWSRVADPYYLAFAPYSAPNQVNGWDYLGFFAATLVLSALLSVLAIWRMRPVAARGTGDHCREPGLDLVGRVTRWLPGPSLDRNPVLWREWHRTRPSRWVLILIVIVGGTTAIACVGGAVSMWRYGLDSFPRTPTTWMIAGIYAFFLQLVFGFLMLSVVAPTSMAEERQRGSLDLLATTTLSTPTIVIGKWLGSLRLVLLLAIGPGLVGLAMATAHKTPSVVSPSPGVSWYDSAEPTRSELLFAGILLVATFLVHGMLLSTIGLALAVWIKRQSRAIAASVGLAALMHAGWPMLIGFLGMGLRGQGVMSLSPVVAGSLFMDRVLMRRPQLRDLLWATSFWGIECLVLSLGLLWLTVWTFDGCFGRIPDRPRRASVLADVVVLLAGLIGVGGLFGSIEVWIKGMGRAQEGLDLGVVASALLIAVGLLLLAVRAPLSIASAGTPRPSGLEPSLAIPDRRVFAARWWESFRLVLLLAIGPALIGLALVTVPMPFSVVPKVTTLPDGSTERIATNPSGITFVTTFPTTGYPSSRVATEEEIAARPVDHGPSRASLSSAACLAVLTVLAHGAAVVSFGLAMGIGFRPRGRAVAASVGLFLFVTVGWPLFYAICLYSPPWPPQVQPTYPRGLALASSVPTIVLLLIDMRFDDVIAELIRWAAFWDVGFILMAAAVAALSIWVLGRRSRRRAPQIEMPRTNDRRPRRSSWAIENDEGIGSPGFIAASPRQGKRVMRWGLGPVFLYECLANARRWQTYAIRSVGVAILLAAIATIANSPHVERSSEHMAGLCRTGRVVLLRDHRRGADPGVAGRPGGDGRSHLRGPRARDPDPHAGHRLVRPGDRAGQAGGAAATDPGNGGLHLAGPGDLLAARRHRSHGLDAGVRHHPCRCPARLHDGPGALGLGQEAA